MNPVGPQPVRPTPARRLGPPAAAQPTPVRQPAPAPGPMVEADVRLRLDAEGEAGANGHVRLDNGFVTRLVHHLLRNPERFRRIEVRFDPAAGAYRATGEVRIKGLWVPVAGRATPLADGGKPAIRFDDLAVRWGPGNRWRFAPDLLRTKVTELVAAEMAKSHLIAEADPARGVIRIEPNALLYKVKALPRWASLDAEATRFGVRTAADGDVEVTLTSAAQGPALRRTPRSDISIGADDQALQAMLFRALAPGYVVRHVRMRSNGAHLEGQVDYKPLSELATGLRVLGALLSGGRVGGLTPVKAMGPLDLEIGIDGLVLDIKPSLKKALPEIVAALAKAGVPHTVGKDAVKADLGPFLRARGIEPHEVRTRDGALEARLEIDIDARIRNPRLRPPARDTLPT